MNAVPVRVGALVALLVVVGAACGRHAVHTSPALMVPSPPAHDPAADEARPPAEGKLRALTQRLRQSARSSAQPSGPRSAPMLGVTGQEPMPQATAGSVVITVPHPAGPHPSAPIESREATAPARPASGPHRDPGIALAVVIAGVLIGAIKLVPRWTDRG